MVVSNMTNKQNKLKEEDWKVEFEELLYGEFCNESETLNEDTLNVGKMTGWIQTKLEEAEKRGLNGWSKGHDWKETIIDGKDALECKKCKAFTICKSNLTDK